jgi:hypothetical protein
MNKIFAFIFMVAFGIVHGQELLLPLNIRKAYDNMTRSSDGKPGEAYWQNHATYKMDISIDTQKDILSGTARIRYFNQSPDTLKEMVFRLYQDFFKKGGARQWAIPPGDVHDGMQITRLIIDEVNYNPNTDFPKRYMTNLSIQLKEPILPGAETMVELDWYFPIPAERGLRMRKYSDGHYFIAYWYPQIAVYDDIDGWDKIEYLGTVEFYNDINDFEVSIAVPGDFVVWATGELQNMEDVLQHGIVSRFEKALVSDETVRIITQKDYIGNKVLNTAKEHAWRFSADAVPDFSFAMSTRSNWDGISVVVDTSTGRRVFTDVVYPDGAGHWDQGAEISKSAVSFMSFELPGYPFPYPQMTSFCNGLRSGGMETPMMANNSMPTGFESFAGLMFHEILHSYFPFYIATNERKYAWMDEGWAAYLPAGFMKILRPEFDYLARVNEAYKSMAGLETEMPPMMPSFHLNDYPSARTAAYNRPAMAFHFLRVALGDNLFKQALLEFIERWKGKHPTPHDFFNTFEDVASEDLSWFFDPWFFDFGYPDLTIKEVTDDNRVTIKKTGNIPVSVYLSYWEDGLQSTTVIKPVSIWRDGIDEMSIDLPPDLKIRMIKLGNDLIPDVNPKDNVWMR